MGLCKDFGRFRRWFLKRKGREEGWDCTMRMRRGRSLTMCDRHVRDRPTMSPVTLAVVGCGQRAKVLSLPPFPDKLILFCRPMPVVPSHTLMSAGSWLWPSPDPTPSVSSPTSTASTKPSSSPPGKISSLPLQKRSLPSESVWQMQLSSLFMTRCTWKSLSHLRSKAIISCVRNPWLLPSTTVCASNNP